LGRKSELSLLQLSLGFDRRVVIPPSLETEEIAIYLDDLFHELAGTGQRARVLV
jgi:hypothetical protein